MFLHSIDTKVIKGGRDGGHPSQARWTSRRHAITNIRGNFIRWGAPDEGKGSADGRGDGQADGRQHHRVPARVRGQAGREPVLPRHLLPGGRAHVRQERPERFGFSGFYEQELELQSGWLKVFFVRVNR